MVVFVDSPLTSPASMPPCLLGYTGSLSSDGVRAARALRACTAPPWRQVCVCVCVCVVLAVFGYHLFIYGMSIFH